MHVLIEIPDSSFDMLIEQWKRLKRLGYDGTITDLIIGLLEEILEVYANKKDEEL